MGLLLNRRGLSTAFKGLTKELSMLRKHLLPRKFNSTGFYRDSVYTKAASYRLLAHAEIEYYIEQRVTTLYGAAQVAFNNSGVVTKTAMSLIAFSGKQMKAPPDNHTLRGNTLSDRLGTAIGSYRYILYNNNGIKQRNIISMLLPVGVELSDLDTVWLASMDSFGISRGAIAHTSFASARTTNPPDPQQELQTVNKLVYGPVGTFALIDVDRLITSLTP